MGITLDEAATPGGNAAYVPILQALSCCRSRNRVSGEKQQTARRQPRLEVCRGPLPVAEGQVVAGAHAM